MINQQLSPHLTYNEVRCKCGQCDGGHLRYETVDLFERIRAGCVQLLNGSDCPIHISSGLRCPDHNAQIGGAENSKHITGQALDLRKPVTIDQITFWTLCKEMVGNGGFGRYSWGAHVDTHETDPPRRWKG